MGRKILANVIGIIASMVGVFIGHFTGHAISPPPEGFDKLAEMSWEEKEVLTSQMGSLDLMLVLAAWIFGAFVGGMVASKILPSFWKTSSLVVGLAVSLSVILNSYMIPTPMWLVTAGIILPIVVAYFGGKVFGSEDAL